MTQRPDDTTARGAGGGFDPHPEGQHAMLCVDVVNLGTRVERYGDFEPKEVEKAALVFVSGARHDDDSLMLVTAEMTLSMFELANMRKFLESWRGKQYTEEQAEEGVPLHKVQGQPALVSIEQITTKRGRKFAKVMSISPLPKEMTSPDAALLEEYVRPDFYEDKKKEYAEGVAQHRESVGVSYPDQNPDDDEFDPDAIPF